MNTLLDASIADGRGFGGFISTVKAVIADYDPLIDTIDILVLTVIFFLAFSFIKSRKAGALIVGIGVCLLIWTISVFAGLKGTQMIFSWVFQFGAFALIILFQSDIRDALEKVGNKSLSGFMNFGDQKKKNQMYSKAIENICTAVGNLALAKTGALIVVERTTRLDEIIQSGITINADVNSFLLRNLFFNKAPLHDVAVVIKEGKIVAAGCLLPLTKRQDVDADLGTRHRAAIGMSEYSDSVIIVVSEETGIISVAYDCELIRNYTPEKLRSFLHSKLLRNGK
jgi:diadenylate cyclase